MRAASSAQNWSSPTADLMPTGSPVAAAIDSTNSMRVSTSSKALWRLGLLQSTPTGIPRIAAISGVTFSPGSIPPRPGFAPWESLISIARTGAPSIVASSRSSENRPASSRQPKYAVPTWKVSAPPLRWNSLSPPSPVLCRHPASAAPSFRAVIAAPDSEPKLMAEMFTTESGRNASRLPWARPSTLAHGTGNDGSVCRGSPGRFGSGNAECFTMM